MAHPVKCYYCGKTFDRDKVECIAIPNKKRYAHKECFDKANEENKDVIALENYIKELFGYKELPLKVTRQINQYVTQNGYTYTGMLKTLKYFYEVKHGDKEKARGGIGIVPYVYTEASEYYYNIWLAQQKNIERMNEIYTMNRIEIPTVEVHIKSPARCPMTKRKRRLFTFLEEGSD